MAVEVPDFCYDYLKGKRKARSLDDVYCQLIVALPMISVWMINRIRYGDNRLFETVPVSRE